MDKHIEIYDNSLVQTTFCYLFESLSSAKIKEILPKLKEWISPNKFEYYAKDYAFNNYDWTEFDKLNEKKDFEYGYLFHAQSGEMIAFGHSFHYSTPPDYFYLRIERSKLDSFLDSNFFQEYTNDANFVCCSITIEQYRRYENEINIPFYKMAGFDIKDVTLIDEFGDGNLSIDRSNSPAREYAIKNAIIGAYWQMWFAPPFYQYVSKEHLLAFPDAFEVRELPNEQVYIKLYEHFNEPHFKKSRAAQHAFLKWIDYEGLVKRDKAAAFPNGIIPDDNIEIKKTTFWDRTKRYFWLWGIVWHHWLFRRNMNLTEEHRKSALVLVKDFRKKGISLDFSLESLQHLEQRLNEEIDERGNAKSNNPFEKDFGWELSKFGAYYGEVLVKQIPNAQWQSEEERKDLQRSLGDSHLAIFGIDLPDGETVYPMEMINNRIEKGKSKDIYLLAKELIEKIVGF